MVTEIQYTNIRRVLEDLMDHPLLRDITLEQVVRHTLRFISLHGYPNLYKDSTEEIEIKDHKGLLPCDLISIKQVRETHSGCCMRAMTDSFMPEAKCKEGRGEYWNEPSFKTQGRIIYTSFPKGTVEVAYKAIPTDEEGFPLLIDNETYLNALEAYIKMKVFTVRFDTGKIAAGILQNAQQDYAWSAKQLQSEFTTPSISEMEALSRMQTAALKSARHFDNGFKNLGDREYIKKH